MRKANKGEWSELYALLKIFTDREVAVADNNLEAITDQTYTFIKVYRNDGNGRLEYNLEKPGYVSILNSENKRLKKLSTKHLSSKTQRILKRIKGAERSTFSIVEADDLMDEYCLEKVKAKSADKADIVAVILDRITSKQPELGFSVKSQLGGASTLLNASSQTNFVYEVDSFAGDMGVVNEISTKSKVRDRISAIKKCGGILRFVATDSKQFNSNLRYIDSAFAEIMAQMLLEYHLGNGNSMEDLTELVGNMGISGTTPDEVKFKLKSFLRSMALGMVPGKLWDTRLDAYGGYLIVKDSGALVCYHLYNDDEFRDYLFNTTKLDTPSTGRHKFGKMYQEDGKYKFKLNLQIRF